MIHDDAAGELLMAGDSLAFHDRLDIRISAQYPFNGMGEGGVAQVMQQTGQAHHSYLLSTEIQVLCYPAGHMHAA
jgi:hypothetical protein